MNALDPKTYIIKWSVRVTIALVIGFFYYDIEWVFICVGLYIPISFLLLLWNLYRLKKGVEEMMSLMDDEFEG